MVAAQPREGAACAPLLEPARTINALLRIDQALGEGYATSTRARARDEAAAPPPFLEQYARAREVPLPESDEPSLAKVVRAGRKVLAGSAKGNEGRAAAKVARLEDLRVLLVEREGPPLPVYALDARMQSIQVLMPSKYLAVSVKTLMRDVSALLRQSPELALKVEQRRRGRPARNK
jgi:hypothetical protein